MTVLKPCPFCGNEVELYNPNDEEYAHIYCAKCDQSFTTYIFKANGDKLTKWWNTRKGEPKRCCMNCKHVKCIDGDRYLDDHSMFVMCDLDSDENTDLKPHASMGTFEEKGIEVCDDWEAKE